MCGIVGMLPRAEHHFMPAGTFLIEALRKLEYRGYDSAGIAILLGKALVCHKAVGKLHALITHIQTHASEAWGGWAGIGHTRWATHGAPTCANAHPHLGEHMAVVHNGIIENFQDIRTFLAQKNIVCTTQTDTEVAAKLVSFYFQQTGSPLQAVQRACAQLRGVYALAFLFEETAHSSACIIGVHTGNPLIIGHAPQAFLLASDVLAMHEYTNQFTFLESGDIAVLTPESVTIHTAQGVVERPICQIDFQVTEDNEKGDFAHYMIKEIYEQPVILARLFGNYVDAHTLTLRPEKWPDILRPTPKRILIVACGTSYYAALIVKNWLISMVKNIWVDVEIASEFRHKTHFLEVQPELAQSTLAIFISQSGETADTLAALQIAKQTHMRTLAVVNVETSSMARQAHAILPIHAGFEIGVASTKAFTAQLLVLALLTLYFQNQAGQDITSYIAELSQVPALVEHTLQNQANIIQLVPEIANRSNAIYLGRHIGYPLALEGALKLKEVAYICAHAYPSGELKHGPIALVDEDMSVVVVAPFDASFDKLLSNVQEVSARGAHVIFASCHRGGALLANQPWRFVEIASCSPFCAPFAFSPFLQLLAYHTAVYKGTDVDQPRNLAKSVTVE